MAKMFGSLPASLRSVENFSLFPLSIRYSIDRSHKAARVQTTETLRSVDHETRSEITVMEGRKRWENVIVIITKQTYMVLS